MARVYLLGNSKSCQVDDQCKPPWPRGELRLFSLLPELSAAKGTRNAKPGMGLEVRGSCVSSCTHSLGPLVLVTRKSSEHGLLPQPLLSTFHPLFQAARLLEAAWGPKLHWAQEREGSEIFPLPFWDSPHKLSLKHVTLPSGAPKFCAWCCPTLCTCPGDMLRYPGAQSLFWSTDGDTSLRRLST